MRQAFQPRAEAAELDRRDWDDTPSLVDPWKLLARFRRRWRLGFCVALTVLIAAIGASILVTPKYQSTASVLAAPHGAQDEPTESNQPPPLQMIVDSNAIDTDAQILASHQLAMEVARKLDLKDDPEFLPPTKPTNGFAPLAILHGLKESLHPH